MDTHLLSMNVHCLHCHKPRFKVLHNHLVVAESLEAQKQTCYYCPELPCVCTSEDLCQRVCRQPHIVNRLRLLMGTQHDCVQTVHGNRYCSENSD